MSEAPGRREDHSLTSEIGFGRRPAVLAVDFINAFTDPELPFGSDLDDALACARDLLDEARAVGVPVFFTTVAYTDPSEAGVFGLKVPATVTLRHGAPEVEVDTRLAPREDEPLIVKRFASAFFGTGLADRLRELDVDTILIVGCTTSGCVRASAVDGISSGFRPMVVRQAVGDRDPAAHDQSLRDIQAKYGDVVPAESVRAYLRTLPVGAGLP